MAKEKKKRWTDADEARLRAWMVNQDGELQDKRYASLVRTAMRSSVFRKALLKNPQKLFKEIGFKPGKGVKVKIVENTNRVAYLVLPSEKKGKSKDKLELSDTDMKSGTTGFVWSSGLDNFDVGDFIWPGPYVINDNNKGNPGGKD